MILFPFTTACKKSITVRVLLSHVNDKDEVKWRLTSEKGFSVCFANDVKRKQFYKKTLIFSLKKGRFFCNGKKIDKGIIVKPLGEYALFNETAYDGYFHIIPDKKKCFCINYVDLEDYIVAVLRTESWPGWPLEVNKAFAITCRSYVASKIHEAKRFPSLYDIKNTNAHQTYHGRHDVSVLKRAVEQTRGIVLGVNHKPILAMFDSCCGSIIPAYIEDFDFNKALYLARTHACTYCQQSSLYSWSVSYKIHTFEQCVTCHTSKIGSLQDVYIVERDKAGLVTKIMLKGVKGYCAISGKQLYSALKEVKSFYFDIYKKGDAIVISGRGFGHHIGLCQWGARQMVREGWDYKSILQFYYPKTTFMKLA